MRSKIISGSPQLYAHYYGDPCSVGKPDLCETRSKVLDETLSKLYDEKDIAGYLIVPIGSAGQAKEEGVPSRLVRNMTFPCLYILIQPKTQESESLHSLLTQAGMSRF